jgi:Na+-transporting NADH:ubiquinone oxidoreductase subunit NqrF
MMERFCSDMKYIPIISEPENEPVPWHGKVGFLDHVWKDKLIETIWGEKVTPDNTVVFLCGHPLMVSGMEEILQADGFTQHTKKNPGSYIKEKFG